MRGVDINSEPVKLFNAFSKYSTNGGLNLKTNSIFRGICQLMLTLNVSFQQESLVD